MTLAGEDEIAGSFGDGDGGGVDHGLGEAGQDGGVDDAEVGYAFHAQGFVHDGADATGAGGVVEGVGGALDEVALGGLGGPGGTGVDFLGAPVVEGGGGADVSGEGDGIGQQGEVGGVGEIVGIDTGGGERVAGGESDGASATGFHQAGEEDVGG